MPPPELLTVRGLRVTHAGADAPALDGVDLDLAAGECVAVVGPSGCGKSTLCRALLDLLPEGAVCEGRIRWRGRELTNDPRRWHALRGPELGLVLQDHRHALDPVRRIGDQIAEVVALHHPDWSAARRAEATAHACDRAQLPASLGLDRRYPHELSGGQRQRANLAAALAAGPAALLADEPTTALDLPVQRELVAILRALVHDDGLGLLLVTHDRDLVPLIADRVVTLPAPVASAASVQAPAGAPPPAGGRLEVHDVTVTAGRGRGRRELVSGVSLSVLRGATVGVVGESGAGKTTLVRAMAGWIRPSHGTIRPVDGAMGSAAARRRAVQLVSQDAAAALDPQQTAFAAVVEAAALVGDRATALARARGLLAEVDLDEATARRRPAALSGGQRQRVQIARALAVEPQYLLADEPASSLDPERRRQLLHLLARVQAEHRLGLLVVSHDVDLLATICDEVVVMTAGLVVERYRPGRHDGPRHPLACDLAAAAPARLDRHRLRSATPVDPVADPGGGCPYASRCGLVEPACRRRVPPLLELADGRFLRCPVVAPRAR
ncbi:ATP-binding cassette domain-containing protein [bacterium]|nr:ATP-binding cassette domain-containing protein [bacterium]